MKGVGEEGELAMKDKFSYKQPVASGHSVSEPVSGRSSLVRLLVVDDDENTRNPLESFLHKHGYSVSTARSGAEMREILRNAQIDLIILDITLPSDDGLTLCREVRSASSVPIILTAAGDETDRIIGLEIGADDYLPKPFNPRELLARIKAVLRRAPVNTSNARVSKAVKFANWRLNLVRRELIAPDGTMMELTGGEYHLLLAFVEYPQRVLSRSQLAGFIRNRAGLPIGRSIDVQVSRLRRKLEGDPTEALLIKTIRGVGYVFVPKVEEL